jgi:hypothetical protein
MEDQRLELGERHGITGGIRARADPWVRHCHETTDPPSGTLEDPLGRTTSREPALARRHVDTYSCRVAHANIIEVVRDAFGEIPRELPAGLENELRGIVGAFYSSTNGVPPRTDGEFRSVYGPLSADMAGLPLLLTELLYSHSVVVFDPLEDACSGASMSSPSHNEALHILAELAPLVDAGIVHLAPTRKIIAASQRDVDAFVNSTDDAYSMAAVPDEVLKADPTSSLSAKELIEFLGPRTRVRATSWAYNLVAASAVDGQYLPARPVQRRQWAWCLEHARQEVAATASVELLVIPSLFAAELPWLTPTTSKQMLSIRANDDHFEAWRRSLRECVRKIRDTPGDARFAADARLIFEDTLAPDIERLRRSTAFNRTKSGLKDEAMTVTLGGSGLAAVSELAGLPLTPLIGLGVGAATRMIIRALVSPEPEPHMAVLAQLSRASR